MNQAQVQLLLHKVSTNCQYFSHIFHFHENQSHFHQNIQGKKVCTVSISKVIVQLSYLLYTCKILKINIYVSCSPVFKKKQKQSNYQPNLYFYFEGQQSQGSNTFCSECNYTLYKYNNFHNGIVQGILNFYTKIQNAIFQKTLEQNQAKQNLSKLISYLRKSIQPLIQNNRQMQVLKCLETQQLFEKNSDLLSIYRSSVFYKIKNNQQVIQWLKRYKKVYKEKVFFINQFHNSRYLFNQIQIVLYLLIQNNILFMQKSSTKNNSKANNLNVGQIIKQNDEENSQKYCAKFYNFDKDKQEFYIENGSIKQANESFQQRKEQKQKNLFTLEYQLKKSIMTIRFISSLQINNEIVDILSMYCSNISFQNNGASFQTIQMMKSQSKQNQAKKYLCFKISYFWEQGEDPSTKILIGIQYVTIYAKIYLQLITRKPSANQTLLINQYNARFKHLQKIFVRKAQKFYQSL